MKRQSDKDIYIEKDKASAKDGQITLNLPRALNPGEILEVFISDKSTGYLTYYFKVIALEMKSYDENGKEIDRSLVPDILSFYSTSDVRDQGNALIVKCVCDYDIFEHSLIIIPTPTSGPNAQASFNIFDHCQVAFVFKDSGLSSFNPYFI